MRHVVGTIPLALVVVTAGCGSGTTSPDASPTDAIDLSEQDQPAVVIKSGSVTVRVGLTEQ